MKNINVSLFLLLFLLSSLLYSCVSTNREEPSSLTLRQRRIYFPLDRCDIQEVITEKQSKRRPSTVESTPTYKQRNEMMSTEALIQQAYFIAARRQYRNVVRKNIITLAINLNDYKAATRIIERSDASIINHTDICGNTAAMYIPFSDMRMSEKISLYSLLIKKGLDINRKNNQQQTALMLTAGLIESPQILEVMVSLPNVDIKLNDTKNFVAWDYAQRNDAIRSQNISKLLAYDEFQRYLEDLKNKNNFDPSLAQVLAVEITKNTSLQFNTFQFFRILRYLKNPTVIINELKKAYDMNITDSFQRNAFFEAIHNVHGASSAAKTIQALANADVNINQQDVDGNTAFMYALQQDADLPTLRALINAGTDLTIKNKDNSHALFLAARYNRNISGILSSLLGAKLSMDDVNSANETPLLLAAKGVNASNASVMNTLIKNSNNTSATDQDGNNLFHLLIKHIDSESFFRQFSITPQVFLQKNNAGVTPVHLVARYHTKNTGFIRTLFRRSNVSFSVIRDNQGRTPLMYAAEYNSNTDIVSYLLIYTDDIESVDYEGNNVLMYAVRNQYDVRIPLLIFNETKNINVENNDRFSALMFAALYSPFSELLVTILESGATVNRRNASGQSCLMLSTLNISNPNSTQLLLDYGARTNDLDTEGKSAIIYAGQYSIYLEHVRALLNDEADRYAVDISGNSFFDYVEKNPALIGFFTR